MGLLRNGLALDWVTRGVFGISVSGNQMERSWSLLYFPWEQRMLQEGRKPYSRQHHHFIKASPISGKSWEGGRWQCFVDTQPKALSFTCRMGMKLFIALFLLLLSTSLISNVYITFKKWVSNIPMQQSFAYFCCMQPGDNEDSKLVKVYARPSKSLQAHWGRHMHETRV